MASTLYLPNSGTAPAISPTPDAAWEDVTILARRPMDTTKAATALATVAFTDANGVDRDILFRQHLIRIAAQTILAQTITFQIRAIESDANNNMFTALGLRVIANDGTTVRGTLLAVTRDANELSPTTLTNRSLTATSTQVIAQDGDWIVAEIGTGGDPGGASPTHGSSLRLGDSAATDLPVNDSTTTDLNPYILFANTLTLYTPPAPGSIKGRRTLHATGARMGGRGL